MIGPLPSLLAAAALLIVMGQSGACLLDLCGITLGGRLTLPASLALGLGLLALGVAAGGALGLLGAWWLLALLTVAGAFASWTGARRGFSLLKGAAEWRPLPSLSSQEGLLLAATLALWLTYAIASLSPPLDGDSLAGYLEVPARFVALGRVYDVAHNFYDNTPLNAAMLAAAGLMLRSDGVAQLLTTAIQLGIALMSLYAFSERHFGRAAAGYATAVLASLGTVAALLPSTKVDLLWLAFDLLAVLLLLDGLWQRDRRLILLAGTFSGLALGTKYTAVGTFLIACALLALRPGLTGRHPRAKLADLIAFALPAVLLAAPWYVRNVLETGNPLYPTFHEVFTGRPAPGGGLARVATGPIGALRLFWDTSLWYTAAGFGKPTSPVFLAAIPGFLILRSHSRAAWLLLGVAGSLYGLWFLGVQRPRHMLVALAVLSVLAGEVWSRFKAHRRPSAMALWGLALLVLVLNAGTFVWVNLVRLPRLSYALGAMSRDQFLATTLKDWYPSWNVTRYVNEHLPQEAAILAARNGTAYYLERDYYHSDWFADGQLLTQRDFSKVLELLHSHRVTHVFLNGYVIEAYRNGYGGHEFRPLAIETEDFRSCCLREVFRDGDQVLYEVRQDHG